MTFTFGDRVMYCNKIVTYIGRINPHSASVLIMFDDKRKGWTFRYGDGRSPLDPEIVNKLVSLNYTQGLYWVGKQSITRCSDGL